MISMMEIGMEERWKKEGERLRRRVPSSGSKVPSNRSDGQPPDPNVFPTGEPGLFVRFPVLMLPLVLSFGTLVYLLVCTWLSGW